MQTIKIDFDNPGLPQRLDVVENDAQSRFFKAVLYKDGKAYTAPSGATYSIMYRGFGPQNEGWYDTISDGAGKRAACSVSGNVVTCEIARQALRVPGHVSVMLCVTGRKGYMLHGWPIDCNCRNDSYTNSMSVESFFYITQVTNADWTSAIQTWEELKNMIDPTLSISGNAADAAKVGEAINAEAERARGVESQLKEDISDNLLLFNDYIAGATIELEKNTNGIPIKEIFKVDGKIVRTDTMTYFPNDISIKTIVTKRIISNRTTITITEDTETGKTIVSAIEEYNMIDNGSNYENWVIAGNGTTASANGIHLVADGNIEAANYSFDGLVDGKTYKFIYEVVSKTINSTMVLASGNFVESGKNVVLDNSIGVHSVNIIYSATSISRLRITLSNSNEDGTYINLCNFKLMEV